MNQVIDIVHAKVARLTSMMEIATIEYSIFCSELVLKAVTTVVKHVEPLPEPVEDVKAFVAQYEYYVSKMIPFFDFLFPADEEEEEEEVEDVEEDVEEEVEPLPVPYVDVKSWVHHMENLNVFYSMMDHKYLTVQPVQQVVEVEPLPEPDEDVKAFVIQYEYFASKMIPFFDFLFPADEEEEEVEE